MAERRPAGDGVVTGTAQVAGRAVGMFAHEGARMFLTGPKVVRGVTHEDVTPAELGGSAVHSRTSGVVHLVGADPESALRLAAHVLGARGVAQSAARRNSSTNATKRSCSSTCGMWLESSKISHLAFGRPRHSGSAARGVTSS